MYIGRYYHRIESKGRVSIPAKFRKSLEQAGVITKGLDTCLAIYDQEQWEKKIAEVENLPQTKKAHRDYIRFLSNDAQELEIDTQGRILITEELKSLAKLEKEVVIVGSMDHIEIWDREKYHEYVKKLETEIESEVENIELY